MMYLRSVFIAVLVGSLSLPAVAQTCDDSKPASAPMSRFEAGDDGTIKDTRSGNVWLRCPVGMRWDGGSCAGKSLSYTFREALIVTAELNAKNTAGRSDWRLPSVVELNSIVEKRCFKPAIDLEAFPYSPESGFWTATSVAGVQPRTWLVHFLNGKPYIANKNQTWRIRLIADQ